MFGSCSHFLRRFQKIFFMQRVGSHFLGRFIKILCRCLTLAPLSPTISKNFMELAHSHFLGRFIKILWSWLALTFSLDFKKYFLCSRLTLALSHDFKKFFMQRVGSHFLSAFQKIFILMDDDFCSAVG